MKDQNSDNNLLNECESSHSENIKQEESVTPVTKLRDSPDNEQRKNYSSISFRASSIYPPEEQSTLILQSLQPIFHID